MKTAPEMREAVEALMATGEVLLAEARSEARCCGTCGHGTPAATTQYGEMVSCNAVPPLSCDWDGYRTQMLAKAKRCPCWKAKP